MSQNTQLRDTDQSESWQATRQKVLNRDGYACRFCDMTEDEHQDEYDTGLHAHHVLPENAGGEDDPENLITVCVPCHRTIESAHAKAVEHHVREDGSEVEDKLRTIQNILDDRAWDYEWTLLDFAKENPSVARKWSFYYEEVDNITVDEIRSKPKQHNGGADNEWDFIQRVGFVQGLVDAICEIDNMMAEMRFNDE